ncbi:GGDEF domain-containing protein [Zoogloea sp. LCSB751]|uniref:GGDEF domain-containing protein n=1 Tax=Zoogloea sp. LCSB751 TaxID=1965277 RepID=UPI0009A53812|nr:GGDEF domain-containing protein [Zoogloea sp. LCSB751]
MSTSEPDQRQIIERALRDRLSLIPHELRDAFHAYQDEHYRRFLLVVTLLGQLAYMSYVLADMIVVPDVFDLSIAVRSAYIALVLPLTLGMFLWSRNIRLLDLLLPVQIFFAAILWFELLVRSSSPWVTTYQYASVIFIVLANLCVQVRFLPSLAISLLISAAVMQGVYRLAAGNQEVVLVFSLVYLPVLLFSLFISWSTTLDRRRAFLRALLDRMTREDLSAVNDKLQALAHIDPLTGIGNRRDFEMRAQRELARAQRYQRPLSLLSLDVDHFKRINDTHGHAVGDEVLRALARVANQELREHDLLARFGGEEFVALLPDTTLDEALVVAERMRGALGACCVLSGEAGIRFTVSVGVAQLADGSSELTSLLKAADKALYQAKQKGRNQVCLAFRSMLTES